MSFVKDDSGYTRGVGAVAAMDAVSPRRRRAAARGAVAMARRDGAMARRTLGMISQIDTGGGGGSSGGGDALPPPRPMPTPLPRRADIMPTVKDALIVKPPGSVLTLAPPTNGTVAVAPMPTTPISPPPPRPIVTVVAGGGAPPMAPAPRPPVAPPPDMPPTEQLPDITIDPGTGTAPSKKASGNLLMYALIGVGAYWLLTRE